MSLEKLISKYLDSELNPSEDSQLRNLIATDPDAKSRFDDAVSLHLAIKEDAKSIKAPDDLLRETEDRILMEIMKEPPLILSSESFVRNYRPGVYALAATIAAFLIITVFNISDMQMHRSNGLAFDQPELEWLIMSPEEISVVPGRAIAETMSGIGDINLNNTTTNRRFSEVSSDAGNVNNLYDNNNAQPTTEVELSTSPSGLDANNLQNIAPSSIINKNMNSKVNNEVSGTGNNDEAIDNEAKEDFAINSQSRKTDNPAVEYNKKYNSNLSGDFQDKVNGPSAPVITPGQIPSVAGYNQFNSLDLLSDNKIELTSFMSTDFYRNGIDKDNTQLISSVSQSIAYSVSDRSKFGIEFGYNEFSYYEGANVKIPAGTEKEYGMKIEGYEPFGDRFISIPVIIEKNKQLFWGTMIYDYMLLTGDRFNINARGGAGFSSDGPLSYIRLYGKVRLVSGVYITLGTEGKVFMSDTGLLPGEESKLWKSTASFIYGLQFNF